MSIVNRLVGGIVRGRNLSSAQLVVVNAQADARDA